MTTPPTFVRYPSITPRRPDGVYERDAYGFVTASQGAEIRMGYVGENGANTVPAYIVTPYDPEWGTLAEGRGFYIDRRLCEPIDELPAPTGDPVGLRLVTELLDAGISVSLALLLRERLAGWTPPPAEPVYYVGPTFSGVGFMLPGAVGAPRSCEVVPAERVSPEVREQGRSWLAAQRVAQDV